MTDPTRPESKIFDPEPSLLWSQLSILVLTLKESKNYISHHIAIKMNFSSSKKDCLMYNILGHELTTKALNLVALLRLYWDKIYLIESFIKGKFETNSLTIRCQNKNTWLFIDLRSRIKCRDKFFIENWQLL